VLPIKLFTSVESGEVVLQRESKKARFREEDSGDAVVQEESKRARFREEDSGDVVLQEESREEDHGEFVALRASKSTEEYSRELIPLSELRRSKHSKTKGSQL
jgi:hypothetical protein